MSPELSRKLAAAVDVMPAFPPSVQKILELTRNVNCPPKDLVQVIDKDPVVTLKVLRVVNSAYYGLPKQMTSINHAVVYLGFNTIKNLALGIAAIGMLPKDNAAGFNGIDHAVVGAMLLEKWRFEPSLIETIRHQSGAAPKDTAMIACVFAANQISKKLELGFGGNRYVEELPPTMAKRLGGVRWTTSLPLWETWRP